MERAGDTKAEYGSVGTVAGAGCHSLLLCDGVFVFYVFSIKL